MSLTELLIEPREKDLGGFSVRRILPFANRRMVGPFIFLDHMGPAQFEAGQGIDVRPHPHIGLATVTYLFQGELFHRDTLGSAQEILPGDVNWMTSGSGIAHSERTSLDYRNKSHLSQGLQSWIALPKEYEEIKPEFHHHKGETLPTFSHQNVSFKIICGKAFGYEAPVKVYSPTFYIEVKMPAGTAFTLPAEYAERALYLISGELSVAGSPIKPMTMPVFSPKEEIKVEASQSSHLVILGGDPFPEERFIWWNFVSTSKDRIVQAQEDWKNGRFGLIPGDDQEFIPLPEVS